MIYVITVLVDREWFLDMFKGSLWVAIVLVLARAMLLMSKTNGNHIKANL